MPIPNGYTRVQIGLHWIIALLVGFQYLANEGMGEAWRTAIRGGEKVLGTGAAIHLGVGLAVLALAVIRIAIKLRRGAPPMPPHEPQVLKITARVTHFLLYLAMLVVPIAGVVAWAGLNRSAGEAHEVLTSLLMILALVHIGGALFQRFVLKSDVMVRMMRPNP